MRRHAWAASFLAAAFVSACAGTPPAETPENAPSPFQTIERILTPRADWRGTPPSRQSVLLQVDVMGVPLKAGSFSAESRPSPVSAARLSYVANVCDAEYAGTEIVVDAGNVMLGLRKKGLEFKNFTVKAYRIVNTGKQSAPGELLGESSHSTLLGLNDRVTAYLLSDKPGSFSMVETMRIPPDCGQAASLPPNRAPA